MMLLLDPTAAARGLVCKTVEVVAGAVVENKRLSEVLAHVKAQQAALDSKRRGAAGRQRTVNNL